MPKPTRKARTWTRWALTYPERGEVHVLSRDIITKWQAEQSAGPFNGVIGVRITEVLPKPRKVPRA